MIFIDAGCYHAAATEQFINWGQLLTDDMEGSRIYSIEPNPKLKSYWQEIRDRHIKHVKDMQFVNKAAWIDDSILKFSETDLDLGASVMPEKRGYDTTIDVQGFDFSQWLKQFSGEEIVIKMNIEGAEYPIMEKMMKDGTDKLVKDIMVEFHSAKMSGEFIPREQNILANFKANIHEWR